jgi:TolA-binding protein
VSSPATRTTRADVWRRWPCALVGAALLMPSLGCASDGWTLFKQPTPPAAPADSLVLRAGKLEADNASSSTASSAELASAQELFRKADYWKASWAFRAIANNTKNTPAVAEEARYFEAECWRLQGYYPRAADLYVKMLNDFPSGTYREQGCQRCFDIANYWLDDTRTEMHQTREKREGQRWFVSQHFVNFDKTKPLVDEQGRAFEKLEQVRYNDMMGPLADKALFLMGSVKFFDEDYKEADHCFSQLVEMHPNSSFAAQAVDMAIVSKTLSTGGSDYDGRKVAEARILVHKALANYPELASSKGDYLERQLKGITLQQAEKDFKTADFYRRTGHPESAYFVYEIVRRRYPGTKYADMATDQMLQLRGRVEKTQGDSDGSTEPAVPKTPVHGPHRPKDSPVEQAPPPGSLPEGMR